ncbi:MAG: hypothetical protein GY850_39825, partial [bacterium]|nr:hypothetical protein [bacterium]
MNTPISVVVDTTVYPPVMYVADYANHRILAFQNYPFFTNGQTADSVIGQPDFVTNSPDSTSSKLNNPCRITVDKNGNLWVCDMSNNRVLVFESPSTTDYIADHVLGQGGSFTKSGPNNGGGPSDSTFWFPGDITFDSQNRAFICDKSNHRVLIFNDPLNTDFKADYVIGQPDFISNSSSITDSTFNSPACCFVTPEGDFFVSDYVNNRILKFIDPVSTDKKADQVFGQGGSFTLGSSNNPSLNAQSLSRPSSLFIDAAGNLYVNDAWNHRLLVFEAPLDTTADFVYGQGSSFTTAAQNLTSEGLNGPRGVWVDRNGNIISTEDTHHRVLIFLKSTAGQIDLSENSFNFGSVPVTNAVTMNLDIRNTGIDTVFVDSVRIESSGAPWGNSFITICEYSDTVLATVSDTMHIGVKFSPESNTGYNDSLIVYYRSSGGAAADSAKVYLSGTGYFLSTAYTPPDSTADVVLGQPDFATSTAGTSATKFNSSRHFALDATGSTTILYIADRNNHRIVGYNNYPFVTSNQPADFVIGQPDFVSGAPDSTASSFNSVDGIAVDAQGNLFVADCFNNRVLVFLSPSTTDHIADFVFGQGGVFTTGASNKGGVSASSLAGPKDIFVDAGNRVYITDFDNHRLLIYDDPLNTDRIADWVIGQPDFASNTSGINDSTLSQPWSVFVTPNGDLFVSSMGGNRVLKFTDPLNTDRKADQVFGQGGSFTTNGTGLNAVSFNWPLNVHVDKYGNLMVAEHENHRALIFSPPTDATADYVFGQGGSFTANTDSAAREGLSNPVGFIMDDLGNILIGDQGNNRVLIYKNTAAGQIHLSAGEKEFGNIAVGHASTFNIEIKNTGVDTVFVDSIHVQSAGKSWGNGFITISAGSDTVTADPVDTMLVGIKFSPESNISYSDSILVYYREGGSASTGISKIPVSGTGYYMTGGWPPPDSTADVVIGQPDFATVTAGLTQSKLGGTTGFGIDTTVNPAILYVRDNLNNRVLGYYNYPFIQTGAPADFVIGQSDFVSNSTGITASKFDGPSTVAVDKDGNLWVGDQNNHRVLVFLSPATTDYVADYVFGQGGSFTTGTLNNGGLSAGSLNKPMGVDFDDQNRVYISDRDNSRVLVYNDPLNTDRIADRVIGQPDFATNAAGTNDSTLFGQQTIHVSPAGDLYVADRQNSRILVFNDPLNTDRKADRVFGQGGSFTTSTINNPALNAQSINKPLQMSLDKFGNPYVADFENHRVLAYNTTIDTTADFVYGQNGSFTTNATGTGTNGLNRPSQVHVDRDGNLVVADNVNCRILIYNSASGGKIHLTRSEMNFGSVAVSNANTLNFEIKNSGVDTVFIDSLRIQSVGNKWGSGFITIGADNDTITSSPADTMHIGVKFTPEINISYSDSLVIYYREGGSASMATSTIPLSGTGYYASPGWTPPDSTADVVLGQPDFMSNTNGTSNIKYYSVRFFAIDTTSAVPVLYIVDTGNNRILGYNNYPFITTNQPADFVIGQSDFSGNGNNLNASGLYTPCAIAVDGSGNLWVTDSQNNRVLVYLSPVTTDYVADYVFGQGGSFISGTSNNGGRSAGSLATPTGIAFDIHKRVYIVDKSNDRVLIYEDPLNTDRIADYVIGQNNFFTGTSGTTDSTFSGPWSCAVAPNGDLYVSEYDNNRILKFTDPLNTDYKADQVFGQEGSFTSATENLNGRDAESLGYVVGLFIDRYGNLLAGDCVNDRFLVFTQPMDTTADHIFGQKGSFTTSGAGVTRDSLSDPMQVIADRYGNLIAADQGNHRVLIFKASSAGQIHLSRTDFSFGNIAVSYANTLNLEIKNSGLDTVFVDSLRILSAEHRWGTGFIITGSDRGTLRVSPVDTMHGSVKFSPESNLSYSDSLVIYYRNSAAAATDIAKLSLSGTGYYESPGWTPPDSAADVVIGQPDYSSVTSGTSNIKFNGPRYIAIDTTGTTNIMYISDLTNNRILGYYNYPFITTNQPADFVIGQPDFSGSSASLTASGLNYPMGIEVDRDGNLWVADFNYNRVLVFLTPATTDYVADYVFGQGGSFTSSTPNNGGISASSL